ncbi:FAD-dependent oxidoreductase [Dyella silvatica]|uniref:FAD-dependent oxidoreductase n=1 Tax=Dyella silvatica TaxID=2992128 RepID=UPI002258BD93|nr:FAD-binding oxidoreductase [Dyella silvatica]
MNRRELLKAALAIPLLPVMFSGAGSPAWAGHATLAKWRSRVRPGDPAWPSADRWESLNQQVSGRLIKLQSPFADCATAAGNPACSEALKHLKNPYYIGDQPALTQTSGWADAWVSQPSVYAVAASSTADVVAAVNFAREHHLRLVVKGGGHSYQGTSDAPDSLLVWTRKMNTVSVHEAFVARGCAGVQAPQPAVSVGAGAMWIDAYEAVTTQHGRYVQGGGCTTVGVAGLVQSGGFGSFSKNFGMASAGLLEAEIVTADGVTRIANARTNPDLFWGIKGGGGGSLGVITRLTLRTRELPNTFGAVFGAIKASSDAAYRVLIAKAISFYQSDLFNRHWGEQMVFKTGNVLQFSMVFQGLEQAQAEKIWAPFLDWLRSRDEYAFLSEAKVLSLPARHFWDAEFLRQHASSFIVSDDRPDAPRNHVLWAGDEGQVGQFLHGYRSAWLPDSLLQQERQSTLVDALFASTREWDMSLHFNKGLAGAPAEEIAAARNTATNPDVLTAFALAICAGEGPAAFPGMPGARPDLAEARSAAQGIDRCMDALLKAAPDAGSYVSESNYFEAAWQKSFWGSNYPRLAAVKQKYDPQGLFFVHHGVGSEVWSADGFTRLHG